ncbi:MAG: hypothetical protein ACLP01_14855 [Solirubrobacteraceae bacterium]
MQRSDFWEQLRLSRIAAAAARGPEGELGGVGGELRSFGVSPNGEVTAVRHDDGSVAMTLRLPREQLGNECHEESIECISAFLLSHPHPQPTWIAIACAVGALSPADVVAPWRSDDEPSRSAEGYEFAERRVAAAAADAEPDLWLIDNGAMLRDALEVVRGLRGFFRCDGWPNPHLGGMTITNTGSDSVELRVDDRRWFSFGSPALSFVPVPWAVELERTDTPDAPLETASDRARRAVATFCVGRSELAPLSDQLEVLRPEPGAPRAWIDEALSCCRAARDHHIAPARLRNRLAGLLERGSGAVWPATFEERTRALPPEIAHRVLVELPSRFASDPSVRAAELSALCLIGELSQEGLVAEAGRFLSADPTIRRLAAIARSALRGEFLASELRPQLWGFLAPRLPAGEGS